MNGKDAERGKSCNSDERVSYFGQSHTYRLETALAGGHSEFLNSAP